MSQSRLPDQLPLDDDREPSEPRLNARTDPVAVFFEQIDDTVQRYGTQVQNVRAGIARALSEESLGELLISSAPNQREPIGRDETRRFKRDVGKVKRSLKPILIFARAAAQSYVLWNEGDEDEQSSNRESIKEHYAKYYGEAHDDSLSLGAQYPAAAWIDIFEREKDVCESEKELEADLSIFLRLDPNNVGDLLAHMRSDEFDTDEYRPFLRFLANNWADPRQESVIEDVLSELASQPDIYVSAFCEIIDRCYLGSEHMKEFARSVIGEENLSWVTFVTNQYASAGAATPGALFQGIPFEDWPAPLQQRLEQAHNEYIEAVRSKYGELLLPYVDRKSFVVAPEELVLMLEGMGETRDTEAKKAKRVKNGRTSIKSRPDAYLPDTEIEGRQVAALSIWASGPNGYRVNTVHDLLAEGVDVPSLISELPAVRNYLKGRSDPDIERDVSAMVSTILDEPYGNGATKLRDTKVTLYNGGAMNKSYPVWHLNPNKRANLSIGDTARQTRIYYVPYRDSNGTMSLAILKVAHKNETEKLKTSFGGN